MNYPGCTLSNNGVTDLVFKEHVLQIVYCNFQQVTNFSEDARLSDSIMFIEWFLCWVVLKHINNFIQI